MPAQFPNAAGNLDQLILRREIDQALDEVEAHAAHAGFMHGAEFGVADAALHRRDAARLAAGMDERVDHRAIIGAMAGGLDHDVARETEVVAQGV